MGCLSRLQNGSSGGTIVSENGGKSLRALSSGPERTKYYTDGRYSMTPILSCLDLILPFHPMTQPEADDQPCTATLSNLIKVENLDFGETINAPQFQCLQWYGRTFVRQCRVSAPIFQAS